MTHRDMAADIDDLSRDYTEEIEAHRLTRERAEKAEAECRRLEAELTGDAYRYEEQIAAVRARAEKAEARLAEMEAKLEGSAADDAFNAIAALCGCPSWDYPGQLVRDVARLKDLYECYSSGCEREQARREKAEARAVSAQEQLVDLVNAIGEAVSDADANGYVRWNFLSICQQHEEADKAEGGEHG